jgi:hypothetical protein
MTTGRGQLTEGALARRLYQLEVEGVDRLIGLAANGAGERPAHGRSGRSGRRRALLGAGLLAAALVLVMATTPLAQAVVAPVSTLLQEVSGVSASTATRLPGGAGVATATSSGVTVTVLGAYGDQFHTVLYVHADADADLAPGTLTDETGHTIRDGGTQGIGDGVVAMQFDPVPTTGRHDLTLRIAMLFEPPAGTVQRTISGQRVVRGDWTLRVPLEVRVAPTFTVEPASGSLGAVHVDIVVSGGSDVLSVRLRTSGATLDQLEDEAPTSDERTSGPGPGRFRIEVRDARGRDLTQLALGGSALGVKGGPAPTTTAWSGSWKATGAGAYQLVLTYRGHELISRFTVS